VSFDQHPKAVADSSEYPQRRDELPNTCERPIIPSVIFIQKFLNSRRLLGQGQQEPAARTPTAPSQHPVETDEGLNPLK
jgi:hypothetical protein